jgi:hypothetical protein
MLERVTSECISKWSLFGFWDPGKGGKNTPIELETAAPRKASSGLGFWVAVAVTLLRLGM